MNDVFHMFTEVGPLDPWVDIEAELSDAPPLNELADWLTDVAHAKGATPIGQWAAEWVHAEYDNDGKQLPNTGGIHAWCIALPSNTHDPI